MKIQYQIVPRFDPASSEASEYLREHGYVVIASALNPAQCDRAMELLWDYLEGLGTGIDRDDCSTWDDDRWPTAVHGGILPSYGIGHSAAQWYIRDVARVGQAFAGIWQTDDLLTSFDGVSLWRPWQLNPAWKTQSGPTWMHVDQHPIGRPGLHCVQGLVNLLPSLPATGGNLIIPGSHRRFADIPRLYPERLARIAPQIDHFRFPKDDPLLAESQLVMCAMEAGDMMLWDSRTIHCSHFSDQQPSGSGLLRAVSLVCMMPRSKSTPGVIEERKRAVESRTSTTNWSDRFIDADQFPQILEVAGRARYRWPPGPHLNAHQRWLVGWRDSEIPAPGVEIDSN